MLRVSFNRLVEKYFLLTIIALMFTLYFVKILCLDVDAISAGQYKVGIKPGDWIEYKINWTVPPPLPCYPVWIRREILDVDGTSITVNITQKMSNGTTTSETKEGDVAKGTGASAMIFIPSNLGKGDLVYIEGFDVVSITGEGARVYLGTERRVVFASFSSQGFDIHIFWDKEKGIALEIYSSSASSAGTTKVIETNLWNSESFDNHDLLGLKTLILIIIIIIILLGAIIIRNKYVRSKRKRRRRKKRLLSLHDV